MKILILGSGGREHALAWKIAQSPLCTKLYVAPGNAGTAQVAENIPIKVSDFEAVKAICLRCDVDLVIVGPEQPLVDGIVDYFREDEVLKSVRILGPGRAGARLEGSKAFAKVFMEKHGIPTAKCLTVTNDSLKAGFDFLQSLQPPYVLKADGLAAGKGVLILDTLREAQNELKSMLSGKFGTASATVVIEEFLKGIEVSLFILTDGKHYVMLPEAKDYKRIDDGDQGLNTGGMGAVSPVPFCNEAFLDKVEERIVKPTLQGLEAEHIDYKGFIFLGLMNDGGNPFVIEYNVRMGDPETEAVMTRIDGDFAAMLAACAEGRLNEVGYAKSPMTAVTVVMVSGGYPETYRKGFKMSGLEDVEGCTAFHAGTTFNSNGDIVTDGGRVLAVTALDATIESARKKAYAGVDKIHFDAASFRHDIGIDLMQYK